MRRREFLASGLAALAAGARPNFLFLMADQFRADALGEGTPNLNALARSGAKFTNAYCPQALCTPSRASLLTGCYPHTTKLDGNLYKVDNAFQMPEFQLQPNWPTLLREAGYYTGYIGKWHLGEADPRMFDQWAGYNSLKPHWMGARYQSEYRSDVETREAIEFLDNRGSKPFMLFVSYYPPHTPYDPPKRFEEMYAGKEHATYYGAVTAVDACIGRVLEKLSSLGLDKNTFVSFTADHGETFGQRMGSSNKTVSYEESAKVPLIIRWPDGRIPAGLEYDGGVSTVDLMPTMLSAAGLPVPKRVQGKNRLEELRGRDTGWKAPVFLENITQKNVDGKPSIERAVRTERWKLILRDHPKNELYDLAADPGERNDLFHKPESKPRVQELAKLIRGWGERTSDPMAVKLAESVL